MTDPIADMLSRIKNALNVRAENVDMPHSKMKESIANLLLSEGYIARGEKMSKMNKGFIRLVLKYGPDKKGVIRGMQRVSRPGRRIYQESRSLPRVQAGFGTALISTSKGVMTDNQARSSKLGGEVLCYIW